jgi:DNA replication protein DnaC
LSLNEELAAILPKGCPVHGTDTLPCVLCEAEAEETERERVRGEMVRKRKLQEHPEDIIEGFGIGSRYLSYSFENFQGGNGVKTALADIASTPSDVVLMGGPGCGKTHLAIATMRAMVQNDKLNSPAAARFVTAPELLMEIRRTYGRNDGQDETDIIERHAKLSLLVLDDLGAEQATDWAVTMLYLIIDRRYRDLRPTIITTNLSLQEIEQRLSMRIASRMADMRVIKIDLPDWRKKR